MKEYSVCQFFLGDSSEYVARYVEADEAMRVFNHYTHSVGARLGTTQRVIITDGGDCICCEWVFGEGVVFPPEAVG